jgi:transposase InsO family protein
MNIPFHFMVNIVAGWVNRHQQAVIDYLSEERQILIEQLGGRPKAFNNSQRIRLARKAKKLGRRALFAISPIVTPDTLLRWYRNLVAAKWTFKSGRKKGRPRVDQEVEKLVLRMLQENPQWGSDRIVGALANLGIQITDTTVDNIRKRNGFEPAPLRKLKTNWDTFLKAHWEGLLAADFFTTEVLCLTGMVRFYTLFVIDLSTRHVTICGTSVSPDGQWMKHVARCLTDAFDGICLGKTHLIIDRDTKFTEAFKQLLKNFGVDPVLCPVRAPKCNAYAERFVRSIKYECLNRIIPLGEGHLELAIRNYIEHYNAERNHQGIENQLIKPEILSREGDIISKKRLGGLLKYYYREAA